MRKYVFLYWYVPLFFLTFIPASVFAQVDITMLSGLKARSIGPASMSGRIAAIAAVNSNPDIIYVGTATGGIFKTTDGAITWKPIFDDQPASSVGAVAINQNNPDVVWIGTGEGNPRNSSGVGRGVFKTLDGGKTWKQLGLEKTEKITRILLDPTNPDIAYVSALGTTWGENSERGVYKTTDGGKTWKRVLFVDNKTGASDLAMDPKNPNKLMAGMWEHRRWPWFFKSGGPGSGLYISSDGGESWKKLTPKEGLPEGEFGRIAVAFAPGKSNVVYTLIEATRSEMLRSDDGGYTFKTVNTDPHIAPRAFYFCDIRVDPTNENHIYNIEAAVTHSIDGGKTFSTFIPRKIHGDHHELWVHPEGKLMFNGNDGGVAISRDGGGSWQFVENLPVSQFYHISVDMAHPYNVYGGLQDNGAYMGPSNNLSEDAIYNYEWKAVGFGDGFATYADPDKPNSGYALWQGGNLLYFDNTIGMKKAVKATDSDVPHRFNWNSGFAIDPFDSKTIYSGSQFVHKSTDRGNTWTIISPDLTTNDPEKQKQPQTGGLTLDVTAAENHCTILTIAPSPVEKGVMWVGTDDGNVQITRDGGKTWKLVSGSLHKTARGSKNPVVPQATWVPHIEASKHDAPTAYVVLDDHRRSNWTAFVFVTRDYGSTWQSIATPEIDGFVHVLEEDPVNKDLLFVGTEMGLFVTLNGGKNWSKWTHGFPTVPINDLVIHPRDQDLVIGTHGRGAYIIDDITPLRTMTPQIAGKNIHLFEVGPTYHYFQGASTSPYRGIGDAQFKGVQRAYGALISYSLNPPDSILVRTGTKKEEKLDVQIVDANGKLINTLKGTIHQGINRVAWGLDYKPILHPNSRRVRMDELNILVGPGTYTAKITYGGQTVSQPFEVKPDPRIKIDMKGLQESIAMQRTLGDMLEKTVAASKEIKKARERLKMLTESSAGGATDKSAPGKDKVKALDKKLAELDKKLVPNNTVQGIFDQSVVMSSQLVRAISILSSSFDPPTEGAKVIYQKLSETNPKILEEVNNLLKNEVNSLEKEVKEALPAAPSSLP